MADRAILLRRQVRFIGALADRETAVMTALAIAGDALVRETRRQETVAAGVADAAIVRRRNMPGRLAGCPCRQVTAVVAGGAIAGDAAVIEYRRQKNRGGVADVTILRGRDMRQRLADTNDMVMTECAITDHAGMIIDAGGEGSRGMA